MLHSVGASVGQTLGFLEGLGPLEGFGFLVGFGRLVGFGGLGFFGFLSFFFLGFSGAAIALDGGPAGLHLFIMELKPMFSQFSKFASS